MSDQDIHIAAKNGDVTRLTTLINNSASLDVKDQYGRTPLHSAALSGHHGAVQVLIDAKASLDSGDQSRWTPLHFAASKGKVVAVQLLVDAQHIHAVSCAVGCIAGDMHAVRAFQLPATPRLLTCAAYATQSVHQ